MLIAVVALIAALQSQTPAPVVQVAAQPPTQPVSLPVPAPPSASVEAATEADAAPESEVEPEAEPEAGAVAEEPRTRQVCRYVELPARRFPVRRCRTVPVEG
ncbi:hypothetical protein [Brevundimonas lenta]|uniref:Uncharacterized protein n=1 Tax=Brevundimonas lenta TaxID=424796 RepID=A0A7W6JBL8_9CAUL|nr:hypothetical protein [Brevundimonas lenta]MBB4081222.1 hypothetical protein [Brevundimonas lenta]